jgi:hypothetical protein
MPHDRADVDAAGAVAAPSPPSRLRRIVKSIWWFHSFFALSFGLGAMLFARRGLAYADKVLLVLMMSWLLMFVALRFIVGPANRSETENVIKKGIRLGTNYIIKQLYQQMFFFLVPLYASSATWSLSSFNWWIAPVLLVCGVVSTLDLVFDNVIMERRWLASAMYGLAMFGALNVLVPLVFQFTHLTGLMVAAAVTPIAVAFLSFSVRSVLSVQGSFITLGTTVGLFAAVVYGRAAIPPAPLAMPETSVGHGTYGSYECLPASKHTMRKDQLDGLRCGSMLAEPGGVKEGVVHVWRHRGHTVARLVPTAVQCDGEAVVYRSELKVLPEDLTGKWQCVTETVGGQLVGLRQFEIVEPPPAPPPTLGAARAVDAGLPADAGTNAGTNAGTTN